MILRRWIPFVDPNPYDTVKQHVFAKLKKETRGVGENMTAQELESRLPYGIQTVTGRLKELREEGHVFFDPPKRKCNDMEHTRKVNAYVASYFSAVEEVGGGVAP